MRIIWSEEIPKQDWELLTESGRYSWGELSFETRRDFILSLGGPDLYELDIPYHVTITKIGPSRVISIEDISEESEIEEVKQELDWHKKELDRLLSRYENLQKNSFVPESVFENLERRIEYIENRIDELEDYLKELKSGQNS